jgi:hypothetical protein
MVQNPASLHDVFGDQCYVSTNGLLIGTQSGYAYVFPEVAGVELCYQQSRVSDKLFPWDRDQDHVYVRSSVHCRRYAYAWASLIDAATAH